MATASRFGNSSPTLEPDAATSYLAPIEKPRGLRLRLLYWFARRQFGMVPRPFSVCCARMPFAFATFYGKVSWLDQKLQLTPDTAILVRERVKGVNHCLWCMNAGRWYVVNKTPQNLPKLDAIHEYRTSRLFSDKERAALDFAGELTETKHVAPGTFAQLARHYSEREICDIVWLVASEFFYNITNHGLNIGSDGLCELSARPRGAAAT